MVKSTKITYNHITITTNNSHNNTMFIIDFDDTLFDTQRFKQARLLEVERLGVSEEEFWITYRQARNSSDGLFTYSDERHAEMLSRIGYDKQEVLQMLEETSVKSISEFVFPDTFLFLKKIKSFGEPMILLSLGNPGFQELKTKGIGVHTFFDRVFIVHDTKKHVLEELFLHHTSERAWFINDKVEETLDLSAQFVQLHPLLKVAEERSIIEYKQSGLKYFSSLTDIADYVETHK